MQLFMAVPMTPSAAKSEFGGGRYHQFVPICRNNRPLSSIQFIASEKFIGGAVDTGKQFIGGVVDTGNNIFPRCPLYRSEITKKPKILNFGALPGTLFIYFSYVFTVLIQYSSLVMG
jgi:hypothetical protein